MANLTEADLAQYRRNLAARAGGEPGPCSVCGRGDEDRPRKRQKYNARAVRLGVVTFASKREFDRWAELERAQQAGEIAWYARQLRFMLDDSGSGEYVADFIVAHKDGRVVVEDTKGIRTPVYSLKARAVEARYRLEIVES